jgi:tripartite-type tricarboxylate transporter receptor subunit TctC
MSQSEFAGYIKADVAKWANVIKTTGINPRQED